MRDFRRPVFTALVLILGLISWSACSLGPFGQPAATPTPAGPTDTATPSPIPPTATITPTPTATPIPESVIMAEMLSTVAAPYYDPGEFLSTLLHNYGTPFPTFEPLNNRTYSVGNTEQFIVGTGRLTARLVYQNDVVNMWIQTNLPIPTEQAREAADKFATDIYPKVREVYGPEANPGIDDDPRLHILTVLYLGPNVAGAFSPFDEYRNDVFPLSNQKEMFYMSWYAYDVASPDYMSALAHEFQHMVQFNNDRNEAIWLNEGLSQVAERISGFDQAFTHHNYLYDSRVQLNTWSRDLRESYSHYGAGYLYLLYIREQYGDDTIKAIAQSPLKSLQSVDDALAAKDTSANEVFANWIVANYLNDQTYDQGQFGYTTESLNPVCPRRRLAAHQSQPPRSEIAQYTPNYVELEGFGEFTINFTGEREVRLIPTNPRGGKWIFWGGNGENSTATLTREFDLTSVDSATLEFQTWYSIDDGDRGFVMASTDDGATWTYLKADSMSYLAPDTNFGPYFDGGSAGGTENPLWAKEEIDLSTYAGKKIQIRFQYDTDINTSGYGWAVDDIKVPELDYAETFEEGEGEWESNGWARMDNVVPQNWAVWLVEYDPELKVTQLELDGSNAVSTSVILPENGRATIILGAMAPLTTVPAQYSLQIGGAGVMSSIAEPPGVLFQDDFENPCGSFTSLILQDYRYDYQGGKYHIEIKTADTVVMAPAGQELSNITVEFDTVFDQPTEDSMLGFVCRYVDDFNYYLFAINNQGRYAIAKYDDGAFTELIPATQSDAIITGAGAHNHVKVTCDGDRLQLTVNDSVLGTINDSAISKGDIALVMQTFAFEGTDEEKRATLAIGSFDNVIVTRPADE